MGELHAVHLEILAVQVIKQPVKQPAHAAQNGLGSTIDAQHPPQPQGPEVGRFQDQLVRVLYVQIAKVRAPLQLEVFGEKLPPPGNSARKKAGASAN